MSFNSQFGIFRDNVSDIKVGRNEIEPNENDSRVINTSTINNPFKIDKTQKNVINNNHSNIGNNIGVGAGDLRSYFCGNKNLASSINYALYDDRPEDKVIVKSYADIEQEQSNLNNRNEKQYNYKNNNFKKNNIIKEEDDEEDDNDNQNSSYYIKMMKRKREQEKKRKKLKGEYDEDECDDETNFKNKNKFSNNNCNQNNNQRQNNKTNLNKNANVSNEMVGFQKASDINCDGKLNKKDVNTNYNSNNNMKNNKIETEEAINNEVLKPRETFKKFVPPKANNPNANSNITNENAINKVHKNITNHNNSTGMAGKERKNKSDDESGDEDSRVKGIDKKVL
jgi:hypothetical protein